MSEAVASGPLGKLLAVAWITLPRFPIFACYNWSVCEKCIAEHFLAIMQAEIFRLHGQLLAAVEDNDAANKAFATSLALWPQLAEGWLSWGTFCDKRVRLFFFPQSIEQQRIASVCYAHVKINMNLAVIGDPSPQGASDIHHRVGLRLRAWCEDAKHPRLRTL